MPEYVALNSMEDDSDIEEKYQDEEASLVEHATLSKTKAKSYRVVGGFVGGAVFGLFLAAVGGLVFKHQLAQMNLPVGEDEMVEVTPGSWTTSWTKSRDYCIQMSDTRPFRRPNQPKERFDEPMDDDFTYREAATYYNMRYAMRHGYHFERVVSADFSDRWGTWPKLKALYDMVVNTECKITIMMDTDAFFTDPYLPLDKILERWGFNESHIIAMPLEPNGKTINTGVVVVRKGEKAKKMLMDWLEYPNRKDLNDCPGYEDGCAHWKHALQYEQELFDRQIKEGMLKEGTLLEIPCNDAWGFKGQGMCEGEVITHFMVRKDIATDQLKRALLRLYVNELDEYLDEDHYSHCDSPDLGLDKCRH